LIYYKSGLSPINLRFATYFSSIGHQMRE